MKEVWILTWEGGYGEREIQSVHGSKYAADEAKRRLEKDHPYEDYEVTCHIIDSV